MSRTNRRPRLALSRRACGTDCYVCMKPDERRAKRHQERRQERAVIAEQMADADVH